MYNIRFGIKLHLLCSFSTWYSAGDFSSTLIIITLVLYHNPVTTIWKKTSKNILGKEENAVNQYFSPLSVSYSLGRHISRFKIHLICRQK